MAKVNLTEISNLSGNPSSAQTAINENFQRVSDQLDLLLSRDGETPNELTSNLDVNSNRVINLAAPENESDAARLQDVQDAVAGAKTANLTTIEDAGEYFTSGNVEGALQELGLDIENGSEYPTTDAETAAGVTLVNATYLPGNVLRYGADPTGTVDSADAFLDAIAQMEQGGAGVCVPPGTYSCSETLTVSNEGWLFEGDDWRSTRINFTDAVDGFVVAARYGKLKGVWLHGQSIGTTGLVLYDANSSIIERVYCHSWTTDGCRVNEAYSTPAGNNNTIVLRDCIFSLNTGCGMRFMEPAGGNNQNSSEIYRCAMSNNTSVGLLLRGFSHRVLGGIYDDNAGGYGIQIAEDGDVGSSVSNLIFRPYIENHSIAGVRGSAKSLKNWIVLDALNANSSYSGHASAEDLVETVGNSTGPYKNLGLIERHLRLQSILSGTTRVQIFSEGTDTNIPFYLFGKGTGGTWLEPFNDTTNGLIKLGQGATALRKYLSATATLNFDLTAVASQDLTVTVTGAVDGDSVALGVPNAAITADTIFWAWVSAADTVTVRAMRIAGTPNPASGTFRVSVFRH